MNPEYKQRLIDALDVSPKQGGYVKGSGLLRREEPGGKLSYCCLGVLADLLVHDGLAVWDSPGSGHTALKTRAFLPLKESELVGLDSETQEFLAGINDTNDTFQPVIDYIRSNL